MPKSYLWINKVAVVPVLVDQLKEVFTFNEERYRNRTAAVRCGNVMR